MADASATLWERYSCPGIRTRRLGKCMKCLRCQSTGRRGATCFCRHCKVSTSPLPLRRVQEVSFHLTGLGRSHISCGFVTVSGDLAQRFEPQLTCLRDLLKSWYECCWLKTNSEEEFEGSHARGFVSDSASTFPITEGFETEPAFSLKRGTFSDFVSLSFPRNHCRHS